MAVTVIVGFGGALLGAIAVFLGALYIEKWRIRRTRTGIVRALVGELRQNAATAILGLYAGGRPATECSSETWRAANFELAQFLDEGLYEQVLFLYTALPAVERFSSRSPVTKDAKVVLEAWLERAKKAMDDLWQLPEAAKFRSDRSVSLARLEDLAKKARSEGEGTADKAKPSE